MIDFLAANNDSQLTSMDGATIPRQLLQQQEPVLSIMVSAEFFLQIVSPNCPC